MKYNLCAWIAAATAISVAPFSPAATSTAAVVTAVTFAPADVTAPAVVKHVDTDVDGDGTRDSVNLTYLGANLFTLSAVTTTGKSSSVSFTSVVEAASHAARDAWYGASAIDGRKGSELIVNLLTSSPTNADVSLGVYTWRSGRLVAEKAPASPWGKAWKINSENQTIRGYRFFDTHGHRYVDATRLKTDLHWARWRGTITRSVWRAGKWVKGSTRTAKTVKGWSKITWGQVAVAGPKLLLDQLEADISGDGLADRVLLYRDGKESYQATVSASGHVASAEVAHDSDPFIGAAEVDGIAGRELLARTTSGGDAAEWKVLGWRNGALVVVPGPFASRWHDPLDSDEDEFNFALSVEGGSHYVVAARTEIYPATGNPVHFTKFVWDVDHWTMKTESDSVLTAEQAATFHAGFTAPDLITP